MIIFFGIKKKNHLYDAYVVRECPKCGRETNHQLLLQKRAFTIFFLPLIPLGTKKYLVCTECKTPYKVKKFPSASEISRTPINQMPGEQPME